MSGFVRKSVYIGIPIEFSFICHISIGCLSFYVHALIQAWLHMSQGIAFNLVSRYAYKKVRDPGKSVRYFNVINKIFSTDIWSSLQTVNIRCINTINLWQSYTAIFVGHFKIAGGFSLHVVWDMSVFTPSNLIEKNGNHLIKLYSPKGCLSFSYCFI